MPAESLELSYPDPAFHFCTGLEPKRNFILPPKLFQLTVGTIAHLE